MRLFLCAVLTVVATGAGPVMADVTIRYRSETSSPMTPAANRSIVSVIYMKGNKGATVEESETTIIDLARQEVTIIDKLRKKYATLPASEYGARLGTFMTAEMPQAPGTLEILKSMKATCETTQSAAPETIQGVQAEENDVTCNMTMAMPENVKVAMPAMTMKFVSRVWSAAAAERLRVPGLWQLSGFEVWQSTVMNPMGAMRKMMPAMAPMMEAMQKGQSALLRSTTEMSMKMSIPGMPAGDTPIMKMKKEMVGLSTELLDDSWFSVPGDCVKVSFDELMKGVIEAAKDTVQADMARAQPPVQKVVIPDDVKAYIPSFTLRSLDETERVAPVDAKGNKLQGMVDLLLTIGPRGNVQHAEVLYGPEELRKAAIDTAMDMRYQPVLRDGAPVAAYTEETISFVDESKEPSDPPSFHVTPEMTAAGQRLQQLEKAFPRSPEQELADMEEDAGGGGNQRRYYRLGEMAMKAVRIGANDKAKGYATELLTAAPNFEGDPNSSRAIHAGHSVLGIVALRDGDVKVAREQLLEAGKAPASPVPTPYGPNMLLASELLKKGERSTVLEYIELCRNFWKEGSSQLDAMRDTVRQGGTPDFQVEMPQ